jgi:hypothetical protein
MILNKITVWPGSVIQVRKFTPSNNVGSFNSIDLGALTYKLASLTGNSIIPGNKFHRLDSLA